MQYVMTLTAAEGGLELEAVSTAADALLIAGAALGDPVELAPGTAVDIPFEADALHNVVNDVRVELEARPVDVNAQEARDRRKSLLVADMDSTIIIGESLDELADHAGIRDEIAAITERAMRGELDFEGALRERVGRLAGLPTTALDTVVAGLRITPGAAELVTTMRTHGAYCVLVSGGFKPVTASVRDRLGFHEDRANTLETQHGTLTGRVGEPILGREAKLETLRDLSRARSIALTGTAAVGDGANDLAMLGAAGLGVAFRAKPAVRHAARFRIEHADLRGLLYLQGYTAAEITGG